MISLVRRLVRGSWWGMALAGVIRWFWDDEQGARRRAQAKRSASSVVRRGRDLVGAGPAPGSAVRH